MLEEQACDLAFVDFNLPDGTGDELIRWALSAGRIDGAFCMTAYANCRNVVAAMRAGAIDVFEKSIDLERLGKLLELPRTRESEDFGRWRKKFAPEIIGNTPALLELLQTVQRVARSSATVLVQGESGTGKEQIAKALHAASPRANRPFIAINCAAIPESLIESELFGHARGAFTGAQAAREGRIAAADGGTLFLDEIGDMPLSAQSKLLRVLQERQVQPVGADRPVPVDVRVIAATHQDLDAMVESGEFREDLYYRISVIPLEIPPLRARAEDIIPLARFFLHKLGTLHGLEVTGFDAEAERTLTQHEWPGNVRELANVVERAVVFRNAGTVTARDLQLHRSKRRSGQHNQYPTGERQVLAVSPPPSPNAASGLPEAATPAANGPSASPSPSYGTAAAMAAFSTAMAAEPNRIDLSLKMALEQVERQMIEEALARTGGNRTEAAALLGLNRSTLVEKIRKLGG